MTQQYLRVYRDREKKEILVNVNHIWKIEVTYAVPDAKKPRMGLQVSLKKGAEDPNALRVYKMFFGNDTAELTPNLDDPIRTVLDEIYKNAFGSA